MVAEEVVMTAVPAMSRESSTVSVMAYLNIVAGDGGIGIFRADVVE